jgi:hypothetical protein
MKSSRVPTKPPFEKSIQRRMRPLFFSLSTAALSPFGCRLWAGVQDASSPRRGPSPPDTALKRRFTTNLLRPIWRTPGIDIGGSLCRHAIFPSGRISIS